MIEFKEVQHATKKITLIEVWVDGRLKAAICPNDAENGIRVISRFVQGDPALRDDTAVQGLRSWEFTLSRERKQSKPVNPEAIKLARRLEVELTKQSKYHSDGFIYSYSGSDAVGDPEGWIRISSITQHDAETYSYFDISWTALKVFQLDPRYREEQIKSLDYLFAKFNGRGIHVTYIAEFHTEIKDDRYVATMHRVHRVKWFKSEVYKPESFPQIAKYIIEDTKGRAKFESSVIRTF